MYAIVNIGILWAIAKVDQQTDQLWSVKWLCNIGEQWGYERRLAKMYNTAKEATEALGELVLKMSRPVYVKPFVPTVTQHIDGYGMTAPRVWVRDMPT